MEDLETKLAKVDVGAISRLQINKTKELGSAEKSKLDKILETALHRQSGMINAVREQIRHRVHNEFKTASGWAEKKAKVVELTALKKSLEEDLNMTGFMLSGNLVDEYTINQKLGLSKEKKEEIKEKVHEVREAVDSATKMLEEHHLNLDKVRTKLLLCSTYGDALTLMKAVFGNTDKLLSDE